MAQFLYKTVKPSGGDYTSLEACMNANEQNLTGDGWFDVEIDGTWSSADTTAVTIHNYTTTASDYINIYTTSTARHDGIANGVGYHLSQNGYLIDTLTNSVNNVTIDGLKITAGGDTYRSAIFSVGSSVVIKNNLIPSTHGKGMNFLHAGDTTIYNNFICESDTDAIYCYGWALFKIYNNTCKRNISYGGGGLTAAAKNNYAASYIGTYVDGFTTNAAADTTGDPAGLDNIAFDTSTFVNVTAGTEDLHIKVGCSLIDVGTDLSAIFTTDIDGVTRSGTWDIGADEYVAAGGENIGRLLCNIQIH